MKLKTSVAFTLGAILIAGLSPALAVAKPQTPSVHQHGSSVHDRSPRMHIHESQPHH
jgi:hypothetical protein